MKKSVWMAAFVAATLSACTQSEEMGNARDGNNDAIHFSTYVGKNTRAGITDINALKAEGEANGFYVLGYSTATANWNAEAEPAPALNFMPGDQVYHDGETSWTYNLIKYWPKEVDGTNLGKVSFFAYAPKVENVVVATPTTGTGFPTLTYTCPVDAADQKDVVVATATDQTKETNSGKVDLTFGHILSKIGFSAKLAAKYENATITVTEMKALYASTIDNTAQYRMDKATWGVASAQFGASDTGVIFANKNKTLTWNDETGAAVVSLNGSDDYLMMLPQTLADDEFKVKLTYTVLDIERGTTITNVVTVNLPGIEWRKGYQYTYVLEISETAVVFGGISVAEWTNNQL